MALYQKFLDSINIERDAENETARLVWKQNIYSYVEDITVSGKQVNMYRESNIKPITRKIKLANINDLDLGANFSDMNYYYEITINMKDGRVITKNIETINNPELLIAKYNVVFKDKDGNILKEETVKEGESATAPNAPTVEGYNFVGWDQAFDNVTSDLEIIALYEKIHVHTEEILPAKEATCTEPGLTEGKKCAECGEILVPQTEVPALGHNFKDGECTDCGEKDPDYVVPEEPVEPETPTVPETPTDNNEKKGCKKDLTMLMMGLIGLTSLAFVVFKKEK